SVVGAHGALPRSARPRLDVAPAAPGDRRRAEPPGPAGKNGRSHPTFDRTGPMSAAPESDSKGRTMALVAAFLGWMFDGLEMGLFPLAGRPALKQLMNATGADADKIIGPWFAGIIAAFLIGAAAGGLLFGWLGDRIGRVKAMVWSVATYSIF